MLDGAWKLIVPSARRGETELYDLSKDPGETKNLASERADIAKTLEAKARAWNATLPTEYLRATSADNN